MANWILKTEPATYSFADLQRERKAVWDGISNPVALKHLRAMAKGDQLLIYHTGKEKACVGLARTVSAPYADPKDRSGTLVVVDIAPVRPLKRPIPLAEIKAVASLKDFGLVRLPRLSVVPANAAQWKTLLAMET